MQGSAAHYYDQSILITIGSPSQPHLTALLHLFSLIPEGVHFS